MAPTFRDDIRNVGGRDRIYDEKVNHQLKLMSINPAAGSTTTRPPLSPLARLRTQRRPLPPRNTTPTAFAKRLSRNRKSQERHETREHLQNIHFMMKKILRYDAKKPVVAASPRPPKAPDELALVWRNGFSLPDSVAPAVVMEAQRRLHVTKQVHIEPTHVNVGVIAQSPRPQSSPGMRSSSHLHLLVPALQAYMTRHQLHVLGLFGTENASGDGAVSAYNLRQVLFGLGLGWSQTDVRERSSRCVHRSHAHLVDHRAHPRLGSCRGRSYFTSDDGGAFASLSSTDPRGDAAQHASPAG
ncbi:hypothetical protein SPRG_05919 [Saprolegnia parasitica CBS 223.65]|uniref:Uncharacterized protein n=1 Tax=Saprolegnia parasitica (strain CBS 223.65) TaxID=695850 RepID=A0A067CRE5_SAPPC|nr:hypothetical protein SPRG_05919 [Saprolegnia parasitica CBS 223.65]KDO29382.1 hypothetical protein SPRG_05919 [Saprolegnia parasitica CBS 223.65]|eukprot:XP_012199885.1 hypothetical protein SPRG_05919 [Saprolegnia parasitica CBS 223.65]